MRWRNETASKYAEEPMKPPKRPKFNVYVHGTISPNITSYTILTLTISLGWLLNRRA